MEPTPATAKETSSSLAIVVLRFLLVVYTIISRLADLI